MNTPTNIAQDQTRTFRVVRASTNTNAFGLREYILVSASGQAWRVLRSAYGSEVAWETGQQVLVPTIHKDSGVEVDFLPIWARVGVECPVRLPDPPPAACRQLFRKTA